MNIRYGVMDLRDHDVESDDDMTMEQALGFAKELSEQRQSPHVAVSRGSSGVWTARRGRLAHLRSEG